MSKKARVEKITLKFDLHALPTAQHRAGLAGLILQIDAMGPDGYRKADKLVPVIEEIAATTATITFTPDSMQGVFDELYAAKMIEVVVAAKWPGETKPKPGEYFISKKDPKTGEVKQAPGFAYDVVQPQAPALMRHLGDGREAWLDLWRQMLWAIPRGGNNVRSRAPFIDRANDKPCGEGSNAWTQAVEFKKRREKSQFKTEPISGALLLGAQAINAEGVPFSGRVDHNLLLHFWQLVVLTYVPQVVDKKEGKIERVGYVLAIPDVADLKKFRHEFPALLQGLETSGHKHTPRQACIDLPAQAGLEILSRLRQVMQKLAMGKAARDWDHCVRAVETYHMLKLGNNVKLMSFTRVDDRPRLVEDYEKISKDYRNPMFRAGLIRAILQDRPKHWGMIELFAEYPHRFFLEIEGETPKYLPHFGRDARALFAANQQEIRGMTSDEMNDDETIKRLGIIVRNMMTSYVNRRAAKKLGLEWDDFKIEEKDGKKRKVAPDPEKFGEQQRRVCNDAFLQIRSRHDEDFVQFFAESICAVPHYFDAKAGDLPFVMKVLMKRPSRDPVTQPVPNRDDIKTLSMLALSAYSFNVRKRDLKKEGSQV